MPHLRGNIFLQYEDIESAIIAKVKMDGRFNNCSYLTLDIMEATHWKLILAWLEIGNRRYAHTMELEWVIIRNLRL